MACSDIKDGRKKRNGNSIIIDGQLVNDAVEVNREHDRITRLKNDNHVLNRSLIISAYAPLDLDDALKISFERIGCGVT